MNKTLKTITNPGSLFLSVGSVAGGTMAAAVIGKMVWPNALLALVFAFSAQMASNAIHRAYDEKYCFGENIDDDLLIDRDDIELIRSIAKSFLIFACTIGLTLMTVSGWWTVIVALLIAILVVASNIGPHPLMRTPWNFVVTFIMFGPIGVIGTSLVQTQNAKSFAPTMEEMVPALFTATVIGLMSVTSHLLYSYNAYRNDLANTKRTFATVWGRKAARRFMLINICVCYALSIWGNGITWSPGDEMALWLSNLVLATGVFLYSIWIWRQITRARGERIQTVQLLMNSRVLIIGFGYLLCYLIFGLPHHTLFDSVN